MLKEPPEMNICSNIETRQIEWVDNTQDSKDSQPAYKWASQYATRFYSDRDISSADESTP